VRRPIFGHRLAGKAGTPSKIKPKKIGDAAEAGSADAGRALRIIHARRRCEGRGGSLLSGDELGGVDQHVKARGARARRVLADNIQSRRCRRPRWLRCDLDHDKTFDMARRLERFHDQRTVNLLRLIRRENVEIWPREDDDLARTLSLLGSRDDLLEKGDGRF
jgi:hypothetical protein